MLCPLCPRLKREGVKDAKEREERPTKGFNKNITIKVSEVKPVH